MTYREEDRLNLNAIEQTHDAVYQPPHYTRLSPQPLDVIEAWGLGFHAGQVLKYIARAGHKGDKLEDLRKAHNYLWRWITLVEGGADA